MPDTSDSITLESAEPAVKGMFLDPSCLPATVLTVPDELKEPQGGIKPAPAVKTPRGLNLGNRTITVVCPDNGSSGDPVTIQKYTFTAIVHFSAVPAITAETLEYIARNELEGQIEEAWHAAMLTAQDLKRLAGMSNVQGRALLKQLEQVQTRLDTAAKLHAESLLHCTWCNTPQEAICPDTAMVHEGTYAGHKAVYHAVVEAGQYCSELSQEDANAKALAAAESMLNCFYINDNCTATCESRPDRPMDVMEHVPNDLEPLYPGRSLRVGTYIVAAGSYISYESKENANEQASDAAYSMLNCWYPNLAIEAECERNEAGVIEARNLGVDPDLEPPREADVLRRTTGQIVNVPVGLFVSDYSTELATQEAEEFAASLLECCFISDEFSAKCAAEEVKRADGTIITLEPELGSPTLEVVVPRGAYTSCISKEEANQFAIDSMAGMLSCTYCNGIVYPTCVPDWVIEGIDAGKISLPLIAGTISYNGHTIATTSLPANATSGLPAGAICDPSAEQAQNLANSLAQSPIAAVGGGSTEEEYCTYYNDLVIVACCASDPYGGLTSGQMGVTPDGMPYIFISLYTSAHYLSKTLTYPAVDSYFRIEAGMWSDVGADKKQDLNARAIRYALSLTQCMFENPPVKGWCGAYTSASSLNEPEWTAGKNTEFGEYQLVDWASTRRRPIFVPRGAIVERGTGNDYDKITTSIRSQALSLAESQIICAYCNTAKTYNCEQTSGTQDTTTGSGIMKCPNNTTVNYSAHSVIYNRPGLINPCFVIADTPIEADAEAAQLAMAAHGCDEDTYYEYVICENEPTPTPTPSGSGFEWEIPPIGDTSPTPSPESEKEYPLPTSLDYDMWCWPWCGNYIYWYGEVYKGAQYKIASDQSVIALLNELSALEVEIANLQENERV